VGRGLDDGEIAAELTISPRTAQTHRSNILRKLKVPSAAKLVSFAVEAGFYRTLRTRDVLEDSHAKGRGALI